MGKKEILNEYSLKKNYFNLKSKLQILGKKYGFRLFSSFCLSLLPYIPHRRGRHSETRRLYLHTRDIRCWAQLSTHRPGAWRRPDCQCVAEAILAQAWWNLSARNLDVPLQLRIKRTGNLIQIQHLFSPANPGQDYRQRETYTGDEGKYNTFWQFVEKNAAHKSKRWSETQMTPGSDFRHHWSVQIRNQLELTV